MDMNFDQMNDNYYDPTHGPKDMWDRFVDYCYDNDMEADEADYYTWLEELDDAAEEAAMERAIDYAMERD